MFDGWPPWLRDMSMALLATVLAWLGSDIVPIMRGQGGVWALLGTLLAMLITTATPWLTRAYGLGRSRQADTDSGPVSDSQPPD